MPQRLSNKELAHLPKEVARPGYDQLRLDLIPNMKMSCANARLMRWAGLVVAILRINELTPCPIQQQSESR